MYRQSHHMNVASSLRGLFKSRTLTVLCLQDIPSVINYEPQTEMNQRKSYVCLYMQDKSRFSSLKKSNEVHKLRFDVVLMKDELSLSIEKEMDQILPELEFFSSLQPA